ncbi:MAG: hypothetical protein KF749_13730 [Bacteroidetes bacterium]|nr:hypothetical protein [Bacteroidota bacterium]MCW5896286.1 hypothetical protein [Bacteroidota bacterium]
MKYTLLFLLCVNLSTLEILHAQGSEGKEGVSAGYHALVPKWMFNETSDVPNKCGLPVIAHFLERKDMDEQTSAAVTNILARPSTHTSILAGPFRIHFDTSGIHEPAILDGNYMRIPGTARRYADSVAAIVNHVLRFETDSLGFLAPPQDNGGGGGPEYDIYIQALGGSLYGSTTPETPINNKPEGGTFTTFMLIDSDFRFVTPDSIKGLPALRVTLAHELHHAIQIGNYGFWTGDVYFYELTSVWMEDAVFTEVNDYYSYLRSSQGHFRNPGVPFNANSFIMYSRGIWGIFVENRYGSGTMLRSWENIRVYRPLEAIDNALQSAGAGLRQAFGEWSVWNFFTGMRSNPARYYPEGTFYPLILETALGFSQPSRSITDSLRALSTRYYDVVGGQTPLKLFTSNINIPVALTGSAAMFPYTYLLNTSKVDERYVATGSGIYVKFDVPDGFNWINVVDTSGVVVSPAVARDLAFPNPFIPTGTNSLKVPIRTFGVTQGTLSIFTTSMDLVYSVSKSSTYTTALGQQTFEWNGRTITGDFASSGVYLYILTLPHETITGKFALIRK